MMNVEDWILNKIKVSGLTGNRPTGERSNNWIKAVRHNIIYCMKKNGLFHYELLKCEGDV